MLISSQGNSIGNILQGRFYLNNLLLKLILIIDRKMKLKTEGDREVKLLRNIKIMKKLLIIIIVSALALGTVGYLGLHYIKEMAKDSEEMYKDSLVPLNSIMQIRVMLIQLSCL